MKRSCSSGRCIRIANLNVGEFFPSHISNIYAENIAQIGTITSTGLPISINNSVFDFIVPATVGNITLVTTNSNFIKFNSCQFRYYGASNNLTFSGAATYDNCLFSGNTLLGATGSVFINYGNSTMNIIGTKLITVTTDTIKSNGVKIELRKSHLSE